MNIRSFFIPASFVLVLAAASASAQFWSDAVMSPQELQAAKELLEAERDMTHLINLDLTAEEGEAFWPLYEEYRQKVRSVRERKLSLVEAYAERYRAGTVDDEFAEMAIKDALKIQLETVKIRQKYWKKFRRIVPATKAARFYQLENKMDTEIDFVLTGGIPVVEDN
jgi:Spy/CpxP family protein refolding chaperone